MGKCRCRFGLIPDRIEERVGWVSFKHNTSSKVSVLSHAVFKPRADCTHSSGSRPVTPLCSCHLSSQAQYSRFRIAMLAHQVHLSPTLVQAPRQRPPAFHVVVTWMCQTSILRDFLVVDSLLPYYFLSWLHWEQSWATYGSHVDERRERGCNGWRMWISE
jgi:hypothetical protein